MVPTGINFFSFRLVIDLREPNKVTVKLPIVADKSVSGFDVCDNKMKPLLRFLKSPTKRYLLGETFAFRLVIDLRKT